ncbi:glyoxalase [Haladaptatus paucihalophilus DX253]|uniref:Glyoxalase n=1 Tax=Haladaptatus paucihalophilus DX253 TaxID=797209 RepID=E7QY78_HALPU|nr:VOC family protein [Haladaptatus paucihalophilus]EFW90544.1 glyoxalase [Haladaptatus paucihalophilus DX253]SHK76976.1 Glyoxalase/Bleomycin resistance protein/Dioxygenase superfamily protein [Haladaptatus paucihalophilus DX253]
MTNDSPTGLLHHVELYASDFEASASFWGWLLDELGYSVYQDWDGGRSWKRGETYIVLVQADEEFRDEPYHRRRPGLNHLAFHAASRDHVDELTETLRSKGVPILYEDDHPFAGGEDHYAVYFEDPERIKVELVAPE